MGSRAALDQPGRRGKGTWAALGAGPRDAERRGTTPAPEGVEEQPRGRRLAGGLGGGLHSHPRRGAPAAELRQPYLSPPLGLPAARPSPRAAVTWAPGPLLATLHRLCGFSHRPWPGSRRRPTPPSGGPGALKRPTPAERAGPPTPRPQAGLISCPPLWPGDPPIQRPSQRHCRPEALPRPPRPPLRSLWIPSPAAFLPPGRTLWTTPGPDPAAAVRLVAAPARPARGLPCPDLTPSHRPQDARHRGPWAPRQVTPAHASLKR